ncbi:acetate--CoA ligase family protein, partial [Clostridioides difficile]
GYRGSEPCDIDALADMMVKLGKYAYENKDEVKEIDLNPVFVYMKIVNKSSNIPLHTQLSSIIREMIETGELKEGDAIMPEREL